MSAFDDLEKENQVSESDKITNINEVQIGDIAYYKEAEKGAVVVLVDHDDYGTRRLKIEAPDEYNPFNIYGDTAVWLRNSSFLYAIRLTQNKLVEKRLPAVQDRQGHIFETQKGTRIIYSGLLRGWSIEPFLSDKRLLELLDASQFPLKAITEEES